MHILFLTHYYPPEVNAPASRASELARAWVKKGCKVTIVTCAPNHPSGKIHSGYANEMFQQETIDGVDVIRIWTFIAANEGFGRRLINYLSYPVSLLANRFRLPDADVIVSTSPQFFCGLAGRLFRTQKRPWILEVRDLWPESIVAVGAMKKGAAIRFLEGVERYAYRRADAIVSVTDSFERHISRHAPQTPLRVIKNGVDFSLFGDDSTNVRDQADSFRKKHRLTGKFVAGYIGTHGMAHSLDTVLQAAEQLRERTDIAFLMVGDGAERARLQDKARRLGLDNVTFLGQRPKNEMPMLWSCVDASLVLLKRTDTFKSVLPSKMFEAMAMAKPVVLGVEGEAKELLDESGGGIAIEPENPVALVQALVDWADRPNDASGRGELGRLYVRRNLDRDRLAEDYLSFIEDVVRRHRAAC